MTVDALPDGVPVVQVGSLADKTVRERLRLGCYLRSTKELEDLDCGSPHDVEYAGSIAAAGPAHLPTDSAALAEIGRALSPVSRRLG